jgi:hypothetical protein
MHDLAGRQPAARPTSGTRSRPAHLLKMRASRIAISSPTMIGPDWGSRRRLNRSTSDLRFPNYGVKHARASYWQSTRGPGYRRGMTQRCDSR